MQNGDGKPCRFMPDLEVSSKGIISNKENLSKPDELGEFPVWERKTQSQQMSSSYSNVFYKPVRSPLPA